jgi:hypothetical protein
MRHGAWQPAILRMIFSRVTSPTQILSLPFLREVPAHGESLIPRVPPVVGLLGEQASAQPATSR